MADVSQSDPRVLFAAERTFLAWIRTGLAFMGFGFVVARFGLFLRELAAVHSDRMRPTRFSIAMGTGLIAVGVIVNITAIINHVHLIRELRQGDLRSRPPFARGDCNGLRAGSGRRRDGHLPAGRGIGC
jgi:putative membrane protein